MTPKIREWILPVTSLVVALSALWYNTWRNEMTERNRNVRVAGFEIIKELSRLQLIANYAHYDQDNSAGNPITGWGQILLIEDLAMVMPESVQQQAARLHEQWDKHVEKITESEADNDAIVAQIAQTRTSVLESLKKLH